MANYIFEYVQGDRRVMMYLDDDKMFRVATESVSKGGYALIAALSNRDDAGRVFRKEVIRLTMAWENEKGEKE